MLTFLFTKTPLLFLTQSLWRDEAFTYILAKRNIIDIIILTLQDFNPPLYYLLIHFWVKLFGHSEVSLRLPSLLFYLGTIYFAHHIILEILNIKGKKSWIYLLFFVFNPLLIYYAFEARMYSLLAFLTTASFYYFYSRKTKPYLLATTLGLYTHYFMILVVITQTVSLLIREIKETKNFKSLKLIILSLFIFLPWVFSLLIVKKSVSSFWIQHIPFKEVIFIPGLILSGYEKNFWFLTSPARNYLGFFINFNFLIIAIIVIGLIKTNWQNKLQKKIVIFFLLWGLFPPILIFLTSFYKPLFLPRYLIFSSVGLIFLLIYCLERIKPLPKKALFVLVLVFFSYYQGLQVKYRSKANLAKTFTEIKSIIKPTDILCVRSELDFHLAEYYLNEDQVYLFDKQYQDIPDYVGKILIPKNRMVNNLPLYPKRAFILNHNLSYEIISLN